MTNEIAGVQPVEKAQEELKNDVVTTNQEAPTDETVTLSKSQVEELVKAAEEASKIAQKKAEEAENYKRGMLKAKGKLEENGLDAEENQQITTKEEIAQIVAEAVKSALPQVQQQDDPLLKANKKIEELKAALAGKNSVSTHIGSNLDKPEVSTSQSSNYWSKEQIAFIKSKGLDPDEVFKNLPNGQNSGFKNA